MKRRAVLHRVARTGFGTLVALILAAWAIGSCTYPNVASPTSEAPQPLAASAELKPAPVGLPTSAAPAEAPQAKEEPPAALAAAGTPAAVAAASKAESAYSVRLAPSDAAQAVLGALDAIQRAGAFRIAATTIADSEAPVQMTIEVVLPDRFRFLTATYEIIMIGDQAYQKIGDIWRQVPIDVSNMAASIIGAETELALGDLGNVQAVSTLTVNGVLAQVYQYDSSGTVNSQTVNTKITLWVDDATGLPIRQQIESNVDGVKSVTVQEIEYDSSISVEAPIE